MFYAVRKRKYFRFFHINFDTGVTVRYGLFRQVNYFRSSYAARQERNHSEKVSEREWRTHFAVMVLFGPQFSAALS